MAEWVADFTLEDLAGHPVRLRALQGGLPVVVELGSFT
jgi:hypothetical protein